MATPFRCHSFAVLGVIGLGLVLASCDKSPTSPPPVPPQPADYTGAYTLTISAAPCAAPLTLPDDAKRRVYTANVTQDAGRLTVTLTDADFIVSHGSGNRFSGFVDLSDGLTFSIGEVDFNDLSRWDIVERLRDTTLVVHGIVTARGTPQAISGTLKGSILVLSTSAVGTSRLENECFSPTHAFEMVRR